MGRGVRYRQGPDTGHIGIATSALHVGEWILSGVRAQRTDNLTKEDDPDRDKTRGIRARQRAIGRELRRMYDGVVSEPVPDEFLDLLRQIDDADDAGDKPAEKKS